MQTILICRYIQTLKGRRRFLSKIKFGNAKEKSKAQRQAVNSMCQVRSCFFLSFSRALNVMLSCLIDCPYTKSGYIYIEKVNTSLFVIWLVVMVLRGLIPLRENSMLKKSLTFASRP